MPKYYIEDAASKRALTYTLQKTVSKAFGFWLNSNSLNSGGQVQNNSLDLSYNVFDVNSPSTN